MPDITDLLGLGDSQQQQMTQTAADQGLDVSKSMFPTAPPAGQDQGQGIPNMPPPLGSTTVSPTPLTQGHPGSYDEMHAQNMAAMKDFAEQLKLTPGEEKALKSINYTVDQRYQDKVRDLLGLKEGEQPTMKHRLMGTLLQTLYAAGGTNIQQKMYDRASKEYQLETTPEVKELSSMAMYKRYALNNIQRLITADEQNQAANRRADNQAAMVQQRAKEIEGNLSLIPSRSAELAAKAAQENADVSTKQAQAAYYVQKAKNEAANMGLGGTDAGAAAIVYRDLRAKNPKATYQDAYNIIEQSKNAYKPGTVIQNPNTGEITRVRPNNEVQTVVPAGGVAPQGQRPSQPTQQPAGPTAPPNPGSAMGLTSPGLVGVKLPPQRDAVVPLKPDDEKRVSSAIQVERAGLDAKRALAKVPEKDLGNLSGFITGHITSKTSGATAELARYLNSLKIISQQHASLTNSKAFGFVKDVQSGMDNMMTNKKALNEAIDTFVETGESTLHSIENPAAENMFRGVFERTDPLTVLKVYYPDLYKKEVDARIAQRGNK